MDKPYVSSVINNYGDRSSVKQDVITLQEIIDRQGTDLLLDCVAEHIGTVANKYKFHSSDRAMTMIAAVDHLENAIKERI